MKKTSRVLSTFFILAILSLIVACIPFEDTKDSSFFMNTPVPGNSSEVIVIPIAIPQMKNDFEKKDTIEEPISIANGSENMYEQGFITYLRQENIYLSNDITWKLFLMSPDGQDIIRLEESYNFISQSWSPDGQFLAAGLHDTALNHKNEIHFWNINDLFLFKVTPFDKSDKQYWNQPLLTIEPGYDDYLINNLVWREDMSGLYLILEKYVDAENRYLFCTIDLDIKNNVPVSMQSIQCKDLQEALDIKDLYIVISFERFQSDHLLIGLKAHSNVSEGSGNFGTYIYDPLTEEAKLLFEGVGYEPSRNGKTVLARNLPGYENCLVEYSIEEKTSTEIYCATQKITYESYKTSLNHFAGAQYSPDGNSIVFAAGRAYPDGEHVIIYGIYKYDRISRKISSLTVQGDGSATNLDWQPLCETCKKRIAEGTSTP